MLIRKIMLLISLIFALQIFEIKAQVYSELETQAKLLFSYEEYEMAKQLYDSLYRSDPYNPEFSSKLGDCYLNTSKFDQALSYYKIAQSFSEHPGDLYYKIASAFDNKNQTDSAIFYFKLYNQFNKIEENALNRIAILYMDQAGGQDSALYYAQKAVSRVPNDPDGYYTLSMIYISMSRYEEAIHTALAGLKINNDYALFNMPIGLGYFHQDNFDKAVEYFENGWKVPGLEEMFVNYLAFSKLLSNTSSLEVSKENDEFRFRNINQQNMEAVLEWVFNNESEYNYSKLIKVFRTEFQNFGLDDYAMFYIGFTSDAAYKPYDNRLMNMNQMWENKNYKMIKEYCENRLDSVPVDFPLYWPLAKIAAIQGDFHSQLDNLIKYYGFSQAIKATGDGKSTESPYLVAYIHHEYEIVFQEELDISEQYLESTRNNNFDVIVGSNLSGEMRKIYFNIDLPYSFLQKDLNISKKKKKRGGN
ncbi:MAG: DUF4919 domain-containing protein [Bacteroidales bacterium]|nr:DUF4919 domain-containing protein [Bacteroidales bacterium]MCF8391081.1 DUF4919 domain-containing protein [Bacteroidales bacterium]